MKRGNGIIRILSLIVCACILAAAASFPVLAGSDTGQAGTDTTEEITEAAPETETDGTLDAAMKMLRADLYVFCAAIVLFIVCTVIFFILRAKKKKAGGG
ncbi:MAG: hypothetical protein J5585_02230 [Clostridia bacterium]|nr:hypothetical protein [Clostridia bacterium]